MDQHVLPGFEPDPTPNEHHPDGGRFPPWVTEQLNANQRSQTRSVKFHRCPRCFAIVMTGLDADILAFTVTVDPTPIGLNIEQALRLIGRQTYEVTKSATSFRIHARDFGQTETTVTGTIVPEHLCGRRLPGFLIPPVVPANDEGLPF